MTGLWIEFFFFSNFVLKPISGLFRSIERVFDFSFFLSFFLSHLSVKNRISFPGWIGDRDRKIVTRSG